MHDVPKEGILSKRNPLGHDDAPVGSPNNAVGKACLPPWSREMGSTTKGGGRSSGVLVAAPRRVHLWLAIGLFYSPGQAIAGPLHPIPGSA